VQRTYPRAAIRLLVCDKRFGRNPKVSILAALEAAARNDLVLISDSNVRARPEYLRAMAAELRDPRVGLVSSVLTGVGEETSGAVLENLQLGSFVAGAICAADIVGHACVVGKSMLFRRSDLARLGGLRGVRHVLAEDYVLGQRFQRAGFRVALSPHVVETVNARWTARRFVERHLRWAQMRRRLNLLAYVGEPLLNPIPFAIALICCAGANVTALGMRPATQATLALAFLVLKVTSDYSLLGRLRGRSVALSDLPLIVVKDLLLLGVWGVGAFRRTVCWRGNVLRLTRGSRLLSVRGQRTAEATEALAREAA
jgi:ceramide glucosyltransferase